MTERIEAQIERFAPGFRDLVLARATKTAAQAEEANPNYVGGDITGGMATLRQTLFRPTVRWDNYKTSSTRPVPLLGLDPARRRGPRHVRLLGGAFGPSVTSPVASNGTERARRRGCQPHRRAPGHHPLHDTGPHPLASDSRRTYRYDSCEPKPLSHRSHGSRPRRSPAQRSCPSRPASPTTTRRPPTSSRIWRTLRQGDRFRFANQLRAWVEVQRRPYRRLRPVRAAGMIGSTTLRLGPKRAVFQAVALPDLAAAAGGDAPPRSRSSRPAGGPHRGAGAPPCEEAAVRAVLRAAGLDDVRPGDARRRHRASTTCRAPAPSRATGCTTRTASC